jgi:hypothetical protein
MKLIFLIFKSKYRYKDIGNFLNSRIYNNFFLINFTGPLLSIFGRILICFKFGRGISLDGNPIIKNKSEGVNIWFGGTSFKIPEKFKNLNNNYVNIKNILFPRDNLFKFYPINIKEFSFQKKLKIVFVSKINLNLSNDEKKIWHKYRKKILNNFLLIDELEFWKKKYFLNYNNDQKFLLYRKFKNLIKYESIKYLKKKFNKELIVVGSEWKKYKINSTPDNYNKDYIKKLYEGNICLDFGSMSGSTSLHPRSIQILEAGGFLMQAKQSDHYLIWRSVNKKILFNSVKEIYANMFFFYSNKTKIVKTINQISLKFKNTNKISVFLKKTFN